MSFHCSSYLLQLTVFFEELNYEVIEENIGYGVNGVDYVKKCTLKGVTLNYQSVSKADF